MSASAEGSGSRLRGQADGTAAATTTTTTTPSTTNLVVKIIFVNDWRSRYLRNNQANGIKNLRCFPACSPVHNSTGFCGQSVDVRVEPTDVVNAHNYVLLGELGVASNPRWSPGDCISDEQFACLTDMHGDSRPSVRLAKLTANGVYKFEPGLNHLCGWSYAWISSKHTSMTEHTFFVYLVQRCVSSTGTLYAIAAVFRSPRFTVFCGRRPHAHILAQSEPAQLLDPAETVANVALPVGGVQAQAAPSKRFKLQSNVIDAASVEGMLARILYAVDMLDAFNATEQRALAVAAAGEPAASALAAAAAASASAAPSNGNDWLESVHALLSPLDLLGDFDDVFESKPDSPAAVSADVVAVLSALAHHLVEETAFTRAIASLGKDCSFEDYLRVLDAGISSFLAREFNMTVTELDGKLRGHGFDVSIGSLKPAFDRLVIDDGAQLQALLSPPDDRYAPSRASSLAAHDALCPAGYSLQMLLDPRLNDTTVPPLHEFAGVWQRTSYDDVTRMREAHGTSPMLAKLIEQVETKFEVAVDGNDYVVNFSGKLASTVQWRIRTDAMIRVDDFVAPLGSTTGVTKTYQAWRMGRASTLRFCINETKRYARVHFRTANGNLMSMHVYEHTDADGLWDVTAVVPTTCVPSSW